MTTPEIAKVKKRDGSVADFEQDRITKAIFKALTVSGEGDEKTAEKVSDRVLKILNRRFSKREIPDVEQIQDIVEEVLMLEDLIQTAKAYILYREQRRRIRETETIYDEAVEIYDKYINEVDWQVKENANMAYSLQGLNNYGVSTLTKRYWLNKIYPQQIREAVQSGDFHIHDLDFLGAYCCGWDLYDLLKKGFGGVKGKVESKPAKHLRTALGQIVNFFFTLQGEAAGAQALSNFDTLLAPFIRYDNMDFNQVKQAMQEFLFGCAVPTRVGFQTPFSNITVDIAPSPSYAKQPVIRGGEPQPETYGEFAEEMKVLNKAFFEAMMEGDKNGRVFTFPIPTVNITHDFPWDDDYLEPMWLATAKYGICYFANFLQSDMKPEDVRSMCCRLRLSNKELLKKGGGLFGANPLTGSQGVATINMSRVGYLSKTKKEFFERLGRVMDLAKESLEIKRGAIDDLMRKGLYPYSKYYLQDVEKMRGSHYGNHFSTIGVLGMNECLLNFMGEDIGSPEGRKFALEVMDFMRDRMVAYQEETGNLYNLESTPAEGASFRLALKDKEKYPDIITAGTKETPYYTNSTQLPVNYTDDVFKALDLQDDLQCKYTGGCVEKGNKVLTNKGLLPIEDIVKDFGTLKPIKALSYNAQKNASEWDDITQAVVIDVKKHDKIRVKGERGLDITTSDWHPFFVMERFRPNPACPICKTKVSNLKAFANHIRWNDECKEQYENFPKYKIVEKRADELKPGDYILQNSSNLFPERITRLNEDLAWLLGFFIGDGCLSEFIDNRGGKSLRRHKVRFFSNHCKALDKLVRILNDHFNCQVSVINNDARSKALKEVSTSKNELVDFLFKWGFSAGKKVYDVAIGREIKDNLNKSNVFSLLSGLMDSDGHIDKKQGDFEYCTVSSRLADDILEICSLAGIMIAKSLKPSRRENEIDIWRLRIPGYEMLRIKDRLSNMVNFDRLNDDFSNRRKRHLPVVRVREVSKVDVADNQFYDLTTQNNHNYLAGKNSLVFVHNTVLHLFLGEQIHDIAAMKSLVKKVFSNYKLPYITLTPTFSVCPSHGYLVGEHWKCPKCTIEQPCEVYSRVVGYIRPVQQWHKGKAQEFKDRKEFVLPTDS
ncbi:MAG: ribonucleoside triphosphate reductase [Candidatus Pacebacteria bacterium]|nr:ribonucleoside triphosphate reductase [Candidatus Paceibacterota bacterium]